MKNSHISKLVWRLWTAAAILCVSTFAAFAQAADNFPHFKVFPTGKGIMLMNKKGVPDYAVLIEGGTQSISSDADGGLRIKTMDGSEVIAYHADAKLYAKTKDDLPETIMHNYRVRHLAQIETEKKQKITIDENFNGALPVFDMRQGKDNKVPAYSSFWSFPISGAKPERRIYLAVVIGDSILILRKDLFNGENAQEQSSGFVGALKTLTLMPPQKVIAPPKKQPAKPGRRKN